MRTYTVRAEWTDGRWLLVVPQVPGLVGQAPRLGQVEPKIRDAIATMLGVDPDSFGLEVAPVTSARADTLVDGVARARDGLTRARREVSAVTQQAAEALKREGLSLEDVGRILGVSVRQPADSGQRDKALGAA
jgi:predicted RNase H-like HicB family nuclease